MAISSYSQPLQSLNQPGITPLPFEEMLKMGQYTQKRYDDSVLATEDEYSKLASTNVVEANKNALEQIKGTFNTEMSDLLERYKGQTYSPDFQRESRKLISKMASDSSVKLMRENKLQSDYDDELARKMSAQGVEYYDPRTNPNAFINEDGSLKSYKAGVRALTYDNQIDEQGTKALQAMVQTGADINNFAQLDKAKEAALKPSSTIYKDKVTSLLQQGYTQKDADAVAKQYINQRFDSFKKRAIDSGMLEYGLKVAKLSAEANKDKPDPLETVPAAPTEQAGKTAVLKDLKSRIDRAKNFDPNKPKNFDPHTSAAYNMFFTADKEEYQNTVNEAKAYFGDMAKFWDDKELLDTYSKAVEKQIGSGPVSTRRYANNKANEAIGVDLLNSGFKITKLNNNGLPEKAVGQMVDVEDAKAELSFKGIAATDPTGSGPIGFYFTNNKDNKKQYVVSIPEDVAQESFPVSSIVGKATQYFGPLADKSTGLLPKDYWYTGKDANGRKYTIVPLRKYDKNNEPAFSAVRVYDTDGTSYAAIKTRLNQADNQKFSIDALINYETDEFFKKRITTGQSLGSLEK